MMYENPKLKAYLQEYDKIKLEQISRIGFRDNLLYVTLAALGGILSFVLSQVSEQRYYALLVIPWVCLILGWAYLINDDKITRIGQYCQERLAVSITQEIERTNTSSSISSNITGYSIFGWEEFNKKSPRRRRRKLQQLFIDEIVFVIPGILAVAAFTLLIHQLHWSIQILCFMEILLMILLGVEIIAYTDLLNQSRPNRRNQH
jgi:hypothetical protein